MSLEIPGLIANSKENQNLTKAELQAKRDSFEAYMKNWKSAEDAIEKFQKQPIQYSSLNNSAGPYHSTSDPYGDFGLGRLDFGDSLKPQPFVDLNQWKYDPYNQGLKPSPNRSGNGTYQTQDMADYLQAMLKPKKSEFEVLLDAMFDTSEKEQFLITLGFEFLHENGEDWMQRTVAGLLEKGKKAEIFDKIFLREMAIKFKNLLISKNSLKMKL